MDRSEILKHQAEASKARAQIRLERAALADSRERADLHARLAPAVAVAAALSDAHAAITAAGGSATVQATLDGLPVAVTVTDDGLAVSALDATTVTGSLLFEGDLIGLDAQVQELAPDTS